MKRATYSTEDVYSSMADSVCSTFDATRQQSSCLAFSWMATKNHGWAHFITYLFQFFFHDDARIKTTF